LGVSWGFPGGYEGVRRGKPLVTPRNPSIKSLQFHFIPKYEE